MSRPKPLTNPEYRPFYEHIEHKDLHLQRCSGCGVVRFPVASVCHACFSPEWEWQRASGRGKVTSWVVFRRQYFEAFPAPYTVVQVEMEEGPRLTANLIESEPESVHMGMPVQAVYEALPEGGTLLQFELA